MNEACGVFAIYAPSENVAKLSFYGLYALQHRGQESAGIASSDGKKIRLFRNLGLVNQVFTEENLDKLTGFAAIAHNRYSTCGSNVLENSQPVYVDSNSKKIAVSHNGNFINIQKARQFFSQKGVNFYGTSDTEVLAVALAASKDNIEKSLIKILPDFPGAYNLLVLTKDKIFAIRDPLGFRPLSLASINGGWVVASETCAFDNVGAKFTRDIKPGEIIKIDSSGVKTIHNFPSTKRSFCIFEYIYFARPDSIVEDELVYDVRKRCGQILAYEAPVKADFVIPIPDSGTAAAVGFSQGANIPFGEGLIKNRYIGRTFIQPDQRIRELGVQIKFNPMNKILKGKRVVIVDDSLVRGTTMKAIVSFLKRAGATKIHARICSPPIKYPCFYGVDMPTRKELFASDKKIDQIRKYIEADSLEYLSLEGLIEATGNKDKIFCLACFTGSYPIRNKVNFSKNIFESK